MRASVVSAAFILAASAAYGARAFAENGVRANQILIGESASLTGTAAESGQQTRDGALAYLELVNRKGGVNGRKIKLVTLDDGGQTKRGEDNTRKLIAEDKVFLLFGYTGRNTSEAALPIITQANIPFLGAATGGETIHGVFNKNVFNVRASYKLETQALVNFLVTTGQKKIGMIYHKDDLTKSNLKMTEDATAQHGFALVGSASVDRNSSDVKEAVGIMSKLNPEAVICNAAVKPLSEFVRQMRKSGAGSQFLSVSFVGSAIVKELGPEAAGVIMAQVVPLPTKKRIPIVSEYQNALAAVGAKPEYSFSGLEGFISAKVLVEGLKRSGKDLTRAGFIKAMEGIRDLDLGDYFVSYSPTNHNGSKYVDITVINKDGVFFN
ncbi:MAG TPA: ABC transporter substrate-binding protein [Burkholderiales bacterium]|nr:ABC transporter substrate-binding protein [Burkholderiales bacterium]